MKEIFPNIFEENKKLFTKNRFWDPTKSKAAAAILKGIKTFPIKSGSKILYLGIADGTTASHFSDIIGDEGIIIGIEIAHLPLKKLLKLCEKRKNIIPIMADARKPESYEEYVPEKMDVVYCDVAQKDQTEILIRNARRYLKSNGFIMYMIKARSIDVIAKPSNIFKGEVKKLEKEGFEVIETKNLEPYERDHAAVIARF